MTNIKELLDNIESTRELLTNIIQVKESLLDQEVVYMSKLLDNLLNEYNRLNDRKMVKHYYDITQKRL